MFIPGAVSRLEFAGVRGGGKGGGGGGQVQAPPQPIVLTDPVNGKTFIQQPYGNYDDSTGKVTYGPTAQDQLNAEIADRQAQEKAVSDAATAKATQKTTDDEAAFQQRSTDAYNTGLGNITNYFNQQGVDPNKYMASDILPALATAKQGIQDLDPNPMSAYSNTLGQSILNNISSGARTRADSALTAALPSTYANSAIGYNSFDPYIGDILSSQFDPVSAQLQNAHKRGTLNDFGYKAALDAMASDRTAGESQIRTLGTGIVNKDRQDINDYISGIHTNIGNMSASALDSFSPSTYTSGASDIATRDLGTLSGDIRNAVGNTKFTDLQKLLNTGGSSQGASAGVTGATDALIAPPADLAAQNEKRGLGSQGAF